LNELSIDKMPFANLARSTNHRLRSLLLMLLVFFAAIISAGAIYQIVSTRRERRAHPMPGNLVDVGGFKMHIDCAGTGTPAVILDSGMGDGYISWRKVQPQIAPFTRVCSYDRAGHGYSESNSQPCTAKVFAEELHTLLHNTAIPPPYVLVGHSMAGYDVRLYTSLYRNEVAGLVLVDGSHPEQLRRLPRALNDMDAGWIREQEFFEFTMPFGLPRLLGFCGNDAEVRAAECNFHTVRESVAELKSISKSAAETKASGSLGDTPLIVLSEDPDAPQYDLPEDLVRPTNDAWQQMQKELAQLSTRGKQVIAKNSGHYIQLDRPDVVIDAVKDIVNEVRQQTVLPQPE
jgi:pimeloyl-ACP methyl ester carboxylesterase